MGCRKVSLLALNVIFSIVGLGLLIIGGISGNTLNITSKAIPTSYHYLVNSPIVLFVLGSIIILISIFGIIGFLKKNLFLLRVYTFALLGFFFLLIVFSICLFWVVSNQGNLKIEVFSTIENVFKNSNNKDLIDYIQTKLNCCGTKSQSSQSCSKDQDKKCEDAFYELLLGGMRFTGITTLVLCILLVLGAIISNGAIQSIRNYLRLYKNYLK